MLAVVGLYNYFFFFFFIPEKEEKKKKKMGYMNTFSICSLGKKKKKKKETHADLNKKCM